MGIYAREMHDCLTPERLRTNSKISDPAPYPLLAQNNAPVKHAAKVRPKEMSKGHRFDARWEG